MRRRERRRRRAEPERMRRRLDSVSRERDERDESRDERDAACTSNRSPFRFCCTNENVGSEEEYDDAFR